MKNLPPRNNQPDRANEQSSLEEVRRRLQSFGYLDHRIERFYLASLSRSASQLFNRSILSFRVGVLAGSLAAALLTAGTIAFNQELLRKAPDVVLLFVYFEVFCVLLFSFLELVLIYLVSAWLRFAEGRKLFLTGQAVSFAVGLAFFGYMLYWGRTQVEYLRLFSNAALITMVFILIISCIFVAKSVWLGFLVAFRESEMGRILPDWKRHSMEVALALAAVLILLAFSLPRQESVGSGDVPVAVLSTGDRWIVVAVDGLPLDILKRLMAAGFAPYLKSVASEVIEVPLRVTQPVVPPVSWTTVATGVPPAEHGILMPDVRRLRGLSSWMQVTPFQLAVHSILAHAGFGQRQPVSGYLRKARTFWEIFSDHGVRTGVVNWWGSWPALSIRGWNISERYYYKLMSGGPPQDETFPPELFRRYETTNLHPNVSGPELDRFYANIFQQQIKTDPVRVAALYLPGLDILNYEFFQRKDMDPFSYTEGYRQHLLWLDNTLREIYEANQEFQLLLIFYQGREVQGNSSSLWLRFRSPTGKAAVSEPALETDVTPLLLYSCGLPVSRMMSTHLVHSLFHKRRLATMPIRFVSSYAKPSSLVESAHAGEFNDLLVEQMKSLGYLQ